MNLSDRSKAAVLCTPGLKYWCAGCASVQTHSCRTQHLLSRLYKILLLCSACNILGNYFFFPWHYNFYNPMCEKLQHLTEIFPGLGIKTEWKERLEVNFTAHSFNFQVLLRVFLLETIF